MQIQLGLSILLIHSYALNIAQILGDSSGAAFRPLQWRDIAFQLIARPGTYCAVVARLRVAKPNDPAQDEFITLVTIVSCNNRIVG
jgi:hypothetical protein